MRREAISRMGAVLLGAVLAPAAAFPNGAETLRLQAAGIELARLSPLTFEMMTRELDALRDDAAVSVGWRRTLPAGETAPEELRVVFLDAPGRGAHARRGVLAAFGPAGSAPTVWVYTPAVVAALGLEPDPLLGSFLAQRALGVALGRVLAHELVHLLAPEVPHGTGLMAPCIDPAALDGSPPILDTASATALAVAARSWQRRGGPPPEVERRAFLSAAAAAERVRVP